MSSNWSMQKENEQKTKWQGFVVNSEHNVFLLLEEIHWICSTPTFLSKELPYYPSGHENLCRTVLNLAGHAVWQKRYTPKVMHVLSRWHEVPQDVSAGCLQYESILHVSGSRESVQPSRLCSGFSLMLFCAHPLDLIFPENLNISPDHMRNCAEVFCIWQTAQMVVMVANLWSCDGSHSDTHTFLISFLVRNTQTLWILDSEVWGCWIMLRCFSSPSVRRCDSQMVNRLSLIHSYCPSPACLLDPSVAQVGIFRISTK